jgi:flagellar hook-length control protein FliK
MTAVNVQRKGGSIRVALNTNAITLGSTMPTKSGFQSHATTASSGQVAHDQSSDADSGSPAGGSATDANAGTASGSNQTSKGQSTPASGTASAQKNGGPSAQTRGNARARRAGASATDAAGAQASSDAQSASDEASTDFSSVMASAIGRSTSATTDSTSAAKGSSTAGSAASSTDSDPPASGAPTDAMAWIAQVLMPTGGAQAPTATPGSSPTGTAGNVGAVGARSTAKAAAKGANGQPAPLGSEAVEPDGSGDRSVPNAQATSQSAAAASNALRAHLTPDATAQALTAQSGDTQATPTTAASATPGADVNALAQVQKLISGLTTSNTTDADKDADAVSATPAAHPGTTAASGSPDAAQAAAVQASSLTRGTGSLGGTTLTIQSPVNSAAFADEVSARVTGLAQAGITQAQLQLNPADLGPVQVHITMQAGQASVWFGANHADTRAALEQSLPRLRELFAGAGMPLTDSGVFREPPRQQPAPSLSDSNSTRIASTEAPASATVTQVSNVRLSLLDTYA